VLALLAASRMLENSLAPPEVLAEDTVPDGREVIPALLSLGVQSLETDTWSCLPRAEDWEDKRLRTRPLIACGDAPRGT